jgi:hypothetical protein
LSKIVLDVDSKNLDTVLIILNNLKQGLVKNISIDNKKIPLNLEAKKAQKKVLEDEFMPSKPSGGKYLSKNDYKERLYKNKGNKCKF